MVFEVIGFGITTTALLITFARYFASNWFPYFMVGLVAFEVGMFTMTKGKIIEPERAPKRSEKSDGNNRDPPTPSAANKAQLSPKNQATTKSPSPAKGQNANNKQEKAAKKAQAKANAAATK